MTDYQLLKEQAEAIIETEPHYVAALSNISALIYESLDRLNWAGFYLMDRGSLLVGPFQGKTACIRIGIGKGVCGTAVKEEKILRVADVHEFPGHIACDSASNSEIVLPVRSGGRGGPNGNGAPEGCGKTSDCIGCSRDPSSETERPREPQTAAGQVSSAESQ